MLISELIPHLELLIEQGSDLNLCIDYKEITLDDFEIDYNVNVLNLPRISKMM